MGCHKIKPGADLLNAAVQVQFLAQFAVVALFGFLHQFQVVFQFFRLFPDRAVDTLQHGIVLVPTPVCPGNVQQFEGFRVDLTGVVNMRPAA